MLFSIISRILSLIPRSNDILLFSSFPDYTDNSFALYQYLKQTRGYKYNYIWIFNDRKSLAKYKDVRAYYRYSIIGFYYYYRSKFVFCTHGLYSFLTLHQTDKIVNLWHGMPLKTIGCLDPTSNGYNPTKADYLVSTSSLFQDIMSRAFNNLDKSKVLILGQPRNDLLSEPTSFFSNRGIDVQKYASVGLWLPTYKRSAVGDIRSDGVFNDDGISFLLMKELKLLDTHLNENSQLLIIKLHPMDVLQNAEYPKFTNILILKQHDMEEQLYPLLGASDYLLTDYSSVWVDYCILNKPIGFVMSDWESYRNSRGFTIENLDQKLPGVVIESLQALCDFIDNPELVTGKREIFNDFCDNMSSARVANYFNL